MTRFERAKYMRAWNKKNREKIKQQRRAKTRRAKPSSIVKCPACGIDVQLTPSRIANRKYKCRKCIKGAFNTADTRRFREKHPDRDRAHAAVAYALKTGKLSRQPCAKCAAVKAEAHHSDYAKPLEVTWLCRKCHHLEHHPYLTEGGAA